MQWAGGVHPHWAETPLGRQALWADTPEIATEAGSTHPTGMHSC